MIKSLTQERLKELLDYDPATGAFVWKKQVRNNVKQNSIAGNITEMKYIRIKIDGRLYYAQRLAWLYVHGEWPPQKIDHINRNPTDNRLVNLRAVSQAVNCQNKSVAKNNSSGKSGVCWHKRDQHWRAQIQHNKKVIHIGGYSNNNDAILAREIAEIFCWGTT